MNEVVQKLTEKQSRDVWFAFEKLHPTSGATAKVFAQDLKAAYLVIFEADSESPQSIYK